MHKIEIIRVPCASTWPIRQEVMWPDRPLAYVQLPNDESGQHYGLMVEDRMIAVISVFITVDKAQFRKFATLEKEQGKGYGSKLLAHVLNELDQLLLATVWCNARKDKVHFYERFGLHTTDEVFSKGGMDYVVMVRSMG